MRAEMPEQSGPPDRGRSETEDGEATERRAETRIPLSTPYRWEFRQDGGFFEGVVSDLSEGGMFVRVANPQLRGSEFGFEVQFADGVGLLSGRAEVAWSCDGSAGSDHAPGMGIRFLDLQDDSLEVVRSKVEDRVATLEPARPESQASEPGPSPASYFFE